MSMVLIGSQVDSKSHSELAEALYSTELKQSVIEDFLTNNTPNEGPEYRADFFKLLELETG